VNFNFAAWRLERW